MKRLCRLVLGVIALVLFAGVLVLVGVVMAVVALYAWIEGLLDPVR